VGLYDALPSKSAIEIVPEGLTANVLGPVSLSDNVAVAARFNSTSTFDIDILFVGNVIIY
jgi:hypothetical protein